MNKIVRSFRKLYALFLLFLMGLLLMYFKWRGGFLNSMRATALWAIIFPLVFAIAVEDSLARFED